MGKDITLRTAVIIGSSVVAGSAAGSSAEAGLAQFADRPLPFVSQVVAGAVTLWFTEKLDRLIADDSNSS